MVRTVSLQEDTKTNSHNRVISSGTNMSMRWSVAWKRVQPEIGITPL